MCWRYCKCRRKIIAQIVCCHQIDIAGYISCHHVHSIDWRTYRSSGFKLESLPPTAAGAKFHSYRAYPVLQQLMRNNFSPTDYGWQYRERIWIPLPADRTGAPKCVLRIVSCSCKTDCRKTLGVKRQSCNGKTCSNTHALAASQTLRRWTIVVWI